MGQTASHEQSVAVAEDTVQDVELARRPDARQLLARMPTAPVPLCDHEIDLVVRYLDELGAGRVCDKDTGRPYVSQELNIGEKRVLPTPVGVGEHAALEHFDLGLQEEAFRFVRSDHRVEQRLRHALPWIEIKGVKRRFFHHQLYGAFYLLVSERGPRRGALLADSMGLGKTTTAYLYILLNFLLAENRRHIRQYPHLHCLPSRPSPSPDARCPSAHLFSIECACQAHSVAHRRQLQARDGASLVIVPAGLIGAWESEFARLELSRDLIDLRLYVHHREFANRAIPPDQLHRLHAPPQAGSSNATPDHSAANAFVVLTSVESYHEWVRTYCGDGRSLGATRPDVSDGVTWARVLRDEAHLTPNDDTRLYQILASLARAGPIPPNFLALTGTPLLRNGVRDVQALIQVINQFSPGLEDAPEFAEFLTESQLTRIANDFLACQTGGRSSGAQEEVQTSVQRLLAAYCLRRHARTFQNHKVLARIPPLECYEVSCPLDDDDVALRMQRKTDAMLKKTLSREFLAQRTRWQTRRGSPVFRVTLDVLLDNVRLARTLATVPGLVHFGPRKELSWSHIQKQGWHRDCRRSLFFRHIGELESTSGKLQALRRFITEWRDCVSHDGLPEHLVIISEFALVCHIVVCFLTHLGVTAAWMHADLSSKRRQALVGEFQQPGTQRGLSPFRVMVGTSCILGQGLTLTRAHRLILMEPSHHAAVEAQNADRTHRLGSQTDVCRFYRFVNPSSAVEKFLVKSQEGQQDLHDAVEWMQVLPGHSALPQHPAIERVSARRVQ
ncbi:hypothetical protein, variant [Phialophora macrospora]|uniref:Helicase C-terminal domain-containing protein n=1 Tax=Phialophora macrospora TaxID=1851006 RepID=A0A0D2F4Z0_9EURO|nr:hypothetical protein PV04_09830 [Phialophora macrospora]KIW62944.1 hypothetical protein, variant [Phialophora macrospora]